MRWALPQHAAPVMVPAGDILPLWGRVRPLFSRIRARRQEAVDAGEILGRLVAGDWLLWIVEREAAIAAAAAVSITAERRGLLLRFEQCAGDGIDWPRAAETIMAWGRERGCARFRIEGRAGWRRLFPKARVIRVTMEGEI